jgi:hypothetical protein
MEVRKLNPPSAEIFLFILATFFSLSWHYLFYQAHYKIDKVSRITKICWYHYDSACFRLSANCVFHFYSPQAIGVWPLSSGERPKKKIQKIL